MPSNRTRFILKIALAVSTLVAAGLALYLVVCMFAGIENYFTKHFGLALVLLFVSVIAFTLPILTKKKYQDDSKDKVMFVVGVLLVLFSILTVVLSYVNLF